MEFLIVLAIIAIVIGKRIKAEEAKRQAQQRAAQATKQYQPQYARPTARPEYRPDEDPRYPVLEQSMEAVPAGGLYEGQSDSVHRNTSHTLEVSVNNSVGLKRDKFVAPTAAVHAHEETSLTGFEECPPERQGYDVQNDAYNISDKRAALPQGFQFDTSKNALIQGILYAEILKKPKALQR